jgi:hypothetical protein
MKTFKEILTEKKVRIELSGQGSAAIFTVIDKKTGKELLTNIKSESDARKEIEKKGWSVGAGITRI